MHQATFLLGSFQAAISFQFDSRAALSSETLQKDSVIRTAATKPTQPRGYRTGFTTQIVNE